MVDKTTEIIYSETKSALLCGVGGQGTVLASRIIAAAAMAKGFSAKTAETIGMAQRGGSVVSHVRIGMSIPSPMIPKGRGDILIGFEPGEAAANLSYLKKDGSLIVCNSEIKPVTASLGKSQYDGSASLKFMYEKIRKCYIINADEICTACGSSKVLNVAVVGALCATGEMNLTLRDIEEALRLKLKPALLEINIKALHMGAGCIK